MYPERCASPGRPARAHGDEVLLVEFSQRAVIVGAEPRCLVPIDREPIQHGKELVAPPAGKLRWQPWGPVGVVHLEAVAENGAEQLGRHGSSIGSPTACRCASVAAAE